MNSALAIGRGKAIRAGVSEHTLNDGNKFVHATISTTLRVILIGY